MRRPKGNRSRVCGPLIAALGVAAMLALPGIAAAKDSNRDRIPDRWEKSHDLSLKVKQTGRDQDRDRLRNRAEFLSGNDPRDRDSDDDGVLDSNENAGTIESFDPATGRLVIKLFGGDTVSGLVTDQTRIRCGENCHEHNDGEHHNGEHHHGEHGDDSGASASHSDDEDRSGPGENSGPGSGSDDSDDPAGHDGTPPGASEDPGRGAEHSANCTIGALVVGAVVDEAELRLDDGVATFEEVELEDSVS